MMDQQGTFQVKMGGDKDGSGTGVDGP